MNPKTTKEKYEYWNKVDKLLDELERATEGEDLPQHYYDVRVWANDWQGQDELADVDEDVTSIDGEIVGQIISVDLVKREIEIAQEYFHDNMQKRGVTTVPIKNIKKLRRL